MSYLDKIIQKNIVGQHAKKLLQTKTKILLHLVRDFYEKEALLPVAQCLLIPKIRRGIE